MGAVAAGATHASHGQGREAAPWAAGERALRAQPGEPQQANIVRQARRRRLIETWHLR
jgi:hypothetical protein